MSARSALRRVHIWFAWIVGVPLLIWCVTGAAMTLFPIDHVRGEELLRPPASLALTAPAVVPPAGPRAVESLRLEQRAAGPRWVIRFADGEARLADPASGRLLPPLAANEAAQEVLARHTGTASVAGVTRTDAEAPPIDLRRPIAAWQVAMSDGTHFYVDAGTGEIVARRTALWRFYDLMWGLHIMDVQTREQTSSWWLRAFAHLAAISVLLALVLLPLSVRRRR